MMKCVFNPDGTMFLVGPDDHRDYEGKTSYVVPDELVIHKKDTDPITKEVGVRELRHDEFVQALADHMSVYSNARKAEYPSIADQLDTLYHGGYDAWKAEIQAIKDKYPKI
jgi:hypothetical protein